MVSSFRMISFTMSSRGCSFFPEAALQVFWRRPTHMTVLIMKGSNWHCRSCHANGSFALYRFVALRPVCAWRRITLSYQGLMSCQPRHPEGFWNQLPLFAERTIQSQSQASIRTFSTSRNTARGINM
eukprot:PhF_6_TR29441/c0_g1_i1/m.43617